MKGNEGKTTNHTMSGVTPLYPLSQTSHRGRCEMLSRLHREGARSSGPQLTSSLQRATPATEEGACCVTAESCHADHHLFLRFACHRWSDTWLLSIGPRRLQVNGAHGSSRGTRATERTQPKDTFFSMGKSDDRRGHESGV